jgi:anaerobic magnesium-protoporphyrin IX monomethyl ester cyclase
MNSYSKFKILFVYPNIQMRTTAPVGIGIISAMLKRYNFQTDLFDVTRYENVYRNPDEDYDASHEQFIRMDVHKDRLNGDESSVSVPENSHLQREKNLGVLPFDWGEKNITVKKGDMYQDFIEKVSSYDPDLIAISLLENTYDLGMKLLECIPNEIPVLAGGVFATYGTDKVISHKSVNYVCRGEGEYPTLDLCRALADGKRTDNIPNIWAKDILGNIKKNNIRPASDINELPWTDFDIFEEELLYTPMQGKVWKVVGFETQRGCPYTCTYCNSPSNNMIYSGANAGHFYRKKTINNLKKELEYLIKKNSPELIYMVADTFLAMSSKELDEFSEFYQSYKIPFWMNTRAETITEKSARHLERMNCLRFNIGIEHGNENYRKNVLKRNISNEKQIRSFYIAAEYADEYTCVANSIIGMPDETPDLVFDTIALNRSLPDQIMTSGAYIFTPYHGTPLRDVAINKNYIDDDLICTESSNTSGSSLLNMPQLPSEEIDKFMRVFSFYVKFPKSRWKDIDRAKQNDAVGNKMFDSLVEEYRNTYVNPDSINKSEYEGAVDKSFFSAKFFKDRFSNERSVEQEKSTDPKTL